VQENNVPIVSTDVAVGTVNRTISFRVPQVVKGAKSKRAKNVLEKKTTKRKKKSQEKGNLLLHGLYLFYHLMFY
jgi:hypothetical protein